MIEPPSKTDSAAAVFKVSIDQTHPNQTVKVDFRTEDATAKAGKDYQAVSGTLSFAPGETEKEISVPIVGGLARGPHDVFTVSLSNPQNETLNPSLRVGIGTILPTPWLSIGDVDVVKGETDTKAVFQVTLNPPNGDQIVTVNYTTADGTARAGTDYEATRGTLTFAPGETSKSIVVPIRNGSTVEPIESFTVKLSAPENAVVRDPEAIGTITSQLKAGSIQFQTSDERVGSDPGTATITVTRANGTAGGVGVDFTTRGGSAISGRDYTSVSGTLNFAPGQTSQTIRIPILADSERTGDRTVGLVLSNPSGGGSLGTITQTTLTIAASVPSEPNAPSTSPVESPPESSPPPATPPLGAPEPTGTTTPEPDQEGASESHPTAPTPAVIDQSSTLVTNTNDEGPGSLRQAILNANTHPGPDTIRFQLPGEGIQTIRPTSDLPAVTDPVLIDGSSQPGAQSKSPRIELSGTLAGPRANGLTITGGGSTIRSLAINGFAGAGVLIQGFGGNSVEANAIGTSTNGETALGNGGAGIVIDESPNNTIGGRESTTGNLVSGNFGAGIVLKGLSSKGNVVRGNHIGTDAGGDDPLGNQLDGIVLDQAPGNRIGGVEAEQGNLISGNRLTGIRLQGGGTTGNVIEGNEIGTDWSGSRAIGNAFDGIYNNGAPGNTIGGTTPGTGNLISGNGGVGVQLQAQTATGNQVQGNLIGTDAQGMRAIGNDHGGLFINSASKNTIGGTSAAARNLISGNNLVGVQLAGRSTTGNVIQGNLIGTDILGAPRLGNTVGVFVGGTRGNTIGGSGTAGNTIAGNLRVDLAMRPIPGPASTVSRPAHSTPTTITGITKNLDGSGLTSLVVHFSQPIDTVRAGNIANYRLRLPGRNQSFNAPDSIPVPFRSASYDSSTASVTLTLVTPLRSSDPVQFRVRGQASQGISGLTGTDGPKSDYISILKSGS